MHCLERGHLMGKIWWSEMELFQRLLQLRQAPPELLDDRALRRELGLLVDLAQVDALGEQLLLRRLGHLDLHPATFHHIGGGNSPNSSSQGEVGGGKLLK